MNTRLSNTSYTNLYETIKGIDSPHPAVSESSETLQLEQEIIMDCVSWLAGKTDEEIEQFVSIAENYSFASYVDSEEELSEKSDGGYYGRRKEGGTMSGSKEHVGMKIWRSLEVIAGGKVGAGLGLGAGVVAATAGAGAAAVPIGALAGAIGGMYLANKAFKGIVNLMTGEKDTRKKKELATKLSGEIKKAHPDKVKKAVVAVKKAKAKKADSNKSEPKQKTSSPKKSSGGGGGAGEWGGKRVHAGRPKGS